MLLVEIKIYRPDAPDAPLLSYKANALAPFYWNAQEDAGMVLVDPEKFTQLVRWEYVPLVVTQERT